MTVSGWSGIFRLTSSIDAHEQEIRTCAVGNCKLSEQQSPMMAVRIYYDQGSDP